MKITVIFINLLEIDEQGNELDDGRVEILPIYQLEEFLKDSESRWKLRGYFFKEFNDDDVDELREENERLKDQLDSIDSKLDDALSWLEDVRYSIDDAKDDTYHE